MSEEIEAIILLLSDILYVFIAIRYCTFERHQTRLMDSRIDSQEVDGFSSNGRSLVVS